MRGRSVDSAAPLLVAEGTQSTRCVAWRKGLARLLLFKEERQITLFWRDVVVVKLGEDQEARKGALEGFTLASHGFGFQCLPETGKPTPSLSTEPC